MTSLTHARVDWLRRGALPLPTDPLVALRGAVRRTAAPPRRHGRGEWPGVVILAGSLALWTLFVLAIV